MANGKRDHRSPEAKLKRKARNARSHQRGVERRAHNRAVNDSQHRANVGRLELASYTDLAMIQTHHIDRTRPTFGKPKRPSKIARALRRAVDPDVQARAAAHRKAS